MTTTPKTEREEALEHLIGFCDACAASAERHSFDARAAAYRELKASLLSSAKMEAEMRKALEKILTAQHAGDEIMVIETARAALSKAEGK